MNIRKQLTVAGLLGLALAGSAFAAVPTPDVIIYIAGANGDRDTANTAIDKLLGGTNGSTYVAGINANYKSSNYAIFQGQYDFGSGPKQVRVKTSYIGATGGIYGLAGGHSVPFIADAVIDSGTPKVAGNDPTKTSAPNIRQEVVPDIALSTNFQATSPFNGNYAGHFYETLESEKVSVLPIVWVGSRGFPADNVTSKQVRLLFGNGILPLTVFTGNPVDRNKAVFATGRNLDAGQRFVAQTESGIGLFTHVIQYRPNPLPADYTSTVASQQVWPYSTSPQSWTSAIDPEEAGNDGVDTGRNLSYVLGATLSAAAYTLNGTLTIPNPAGGPAITPVAGYYVSYVTPGDANNITGITNTPDGVNPVRLKWNGIAYSEQAVREGQYTFWTYEQVFWKSNLASQKPPADAFRQSLINQIRNVDASVAGIFLDTVYVERSGEGGLVTLTYF